MDRTKPIYKRADQPQLSATAGQEGRSFEAVARFPLPRQAMTKTIQRREVPDDTPRDQMTRSDWHSSDRDDMNAQWDAACTYNLAHGLSSEYTRPRERTEFYQWFYNRISKKGFEVRWPLAASLVSGGMSKMLEGMFDSFPDGEGIIANSLQQVALTGNQVIFDEVFPKLKALDEGPVLKGKAAMQWDIQTLSEEQTLVQPMYDVMDAETFEQFEDLAKGRGFKFWLGSKLYQDMPDHKGPYQHYKEIPGSRGDFKQIEDRFQAGMELANQFSTHPRHTSKPQMAKVSEAFSSGAVFNKYNRFPHLHAFDALIGDYFVDEDKAVKLVQQMSAEEMQRFGISYQRVAQTLKALSTEELIKAFKNKPHVPVAIAGEMAAAMAED